MNEIEAVAHDAVPVASPLKETPGTLALLSLEAQVAAMGNAAKLAEAMCSTQMVPKHFQGKPADGAAAILYGAELGMNAIQSLQNVIVINGKPSVEARTAQALLMRRGIRFQTIESTPTKVTVTVSNPAEGLSETCEWTIERAAQAGYTKNPQYERIPQQMLYAKAVMEGARKVDPGGLMGMPYSTEELRLDQTVRMEATRLDKQPTAERVASALSKRKKATPEAVQLESQSGTLFTPDMVKALIDDAPSREALNDIFTEYLEPNKDAPEYEELRNYGAHKNKELAEAEREN